MRFDDHSCCQGKGNAVLHLINCLVALVVDLVSIASPTVQPSDERFTEPALEPLQIVRIAQATSPQVRALPLQIQVLVVMC